MGARVGLGHVTPTQDRQIEKSMYFVTATEISNALIDQYVVFIITFATLNNLLFYLSS